jgi:hypothetical protein
MFRFFRGVMAFTVGVWITALLVYLSPELLSARRLIFQFFRSVFESK